MSSAFDPFNNNNPYAASSTQSPGFPAQRRSSLPGYCVTMFIISLVFCVLRVLLVGLGIVGMIAISRMPSPPPQATGALWEVLSGVGIAFFGITGNSLMLARKPIGFYFGVMLALCVAASFIVGIVQAFSAAQAVPQGSPEFIGLLVGAAMMMLIRAALLVAYIVALAKFRTWCATSV
jgi:hypothetical protein